MCNTSMGEDLGSLAMMIDFGTKNMFLHHSAQKFLTAKQDSALPSLMGVHYCTDTNIYMFKEAYMHS